MPHAESTTLTESMAPSSPTTNGEKPRSQFLSHLSSYPLVSDAIKTYKSTILGQQTISLAHAAQTRVLDPLSSYAATPISYVAPYFEAADSLGHSALTHLDEHFPLITKDTECVKNTVVDFALAPVVFPLEYASMGKDYVVETYGKEYKNCGGDGFVAMGKAVVGTGLTVVGDATAALHEFVVKKEHQIEVKVKKARDGVKKSN